MTKGNNGTGNIESRDTWQTPKLLFYKLNNQYEFDFDCCANKDNAKCLKFSNDFLNEGYWIKADNKVCWMNPPFSKARKMFDHFFKSIHKGVAIYRCDNLETALWQDVILPYATWIFIPSGRINYEAKVGKRSRFPSALIGFNVEIPKHLNGFTLRVN